MIVTYLYFTFHDRILHQPILIKDQKFSPTYIFRQHPYTGGTLKLRPVKLLFVIFGRLSYLILKNRIFYIENDRFMTDFLPEVVQMVSIMNFCQSV